MKNLDYDTDLIIEEDGANPIEQKIEEKIKKMELGNKTKLLEKVCEEAEIHNGGMVSIYNLPDN